METFGLMLLELETYLLHTPWWILCLQAVLIWIVYLAIKGIFFITIIRMSGRYRQPVSYERGGLNTILLVGDSTAVGTGAKDQASTLAAFLAKDFPHTNIINKAINGSLTKSVVEQLDEMSGQVFDLIIISTGGNDVWSMTRSAPLKQQISLALQKSKLMSNNRAVLLFFGNEGSAPFFPMFLTGLLMRRTEIVRSIFATVANSERVPFIELFSNAQQNPFVKEPEKFFAPDGLHPNDAGYWEWYKHLWRLMISENFFFHEKHSVTNNF